MPFIVAGPGIKAGANSHVRVSAIDLFPTFADLAGVKETIPDVVEGGSLVSVFMDEGNGTVKRPREELVIDFPPTDKDGQGPALAILLGDYKLIRIYETGERKLFNLSKDISESNDLAKQMPKKVAELEKRLFEYLNSVNAKMP